MHGELELEPNGEPCKLTLMYRRPQISMNKTQDRGKIIPLGRPIIFQSQPGSTAASINLPTNSYSPSPLFLTSYLSLRRFPLFSITCKH